LQHNYSITKYDFDNRQAKLRFSYTDNKRLPLNFFRCIALRDERINCIPVPQGKTVLLPGPGVGMSKCCFN